MQRSALCRSRRELSNEYLLAKFGIGRFDTAENEPCKVCLLSAYRSLRLVIGNYFLLRLPPDSFFYSPGLRRYFWMRGCLHISLQKGSELASMRWVELNCMSARRATGLPLWLGVTERPRGMRKMSGGIYPRMSLSNRTQECQPHKANRSYISNCQMNHHCSPLLIWFFRVVISCLSQDCKVVC